MGVFGTGVFGMGVFGMGVFGMGVFGTGVFGMGVFGMGVFGTGVSVMPTGAFDVSAAVSGREPKTNATIIRLMKRVTNVWRFMEYSFNGIQSSSDTSTGPAHRSRPGSVSGPGPVDWTVG
jgi:hypothetical protein